LEKIEVASVRQIAVDQSPERLKKWLTVITSYKGKVDVEPKARTLFLTAIATALAPIAYSYLKEQLMYLPAKNYDATIYYAPTTNMLEKVVFTRKANLPTTTTPTSTLLNTLPSVLP
jgi:hypothetical protein